ncbi:MAG: murein biosynthesis integral membrane protein MurJ, partial [Steroidobacteraceae bacterium]
TGLSAGLNSLLLYRGLRRSGVLVPGQAWSRLLPRVGLASVAMVAFLWWASGEWSAWSDWTVAERVLRLAACVVGGGATYFATLAVTGLRPREVLGQKQG